MLKSYLLTWPWVSPSCQKIGFLVSSWGIALVGKECIWSWKASHAEAQSSDKRKFGNGPSSYVKELPTGILAPYPDLNRAIFQSHILTPHYLSRLRAGSRNEDQLGFMGTAVGAGEKDRTWDQILLKHRAGFLWRAEGRAWLASVSMFKSTSQCHLLPCILANYLWIYLGTKLTCLGLDLFVLFQVFYLPSSTCEWCEMGWESRDGRGTGGVGKRKKWTKRRMLKWGQTAVIWFRKQALWDRKHLTKCVTLGRRFASESLSLPICKMELRMPLWENWCEDELRCFKSGWPSLCAWWVFIRWWLLFWKGKEDRRRQYGGYWGNDHVDSYHFLLFFLFI